MGFKHGGAADPLKHDGLGAAPNVTVSGKKWQSGVEPLSVKADAAVVQSRDVF